MLLLFSLIDFFAFKERITVVISAGFVGMKKKEFYYYLSVIGQVFGCRRNKFKQVFPILAKIGLIHCKLPLISQESLISCLSLYGKSFCFTFWLS